VKRAGDKNVCKVVVGAPEKYKYRPLENIPDVNERLVLKLYLKTSVMGECGLDLSGSREKPGATSCVNCIDLYVS
jgi:hypothetical protein